MKRPHDLDDLDGVWQNMHELHKRLEELETEAGLISNV